MESILTSIKKLLGIQEEYEHFDIDIIIHINTAFATLTQLGIGPTEGFSIQDASAMWFDFMYNDVRLGPVKTYIYLRVKILFDPPTSSFVMDSMKNTISELEWRLREEMDSIESEG